MESPDRRQSDGGGERGGQQDQGGEGEEQSFHRFGAGDGRINDAGLHFQGECDPGLLRGQNTRIDFEATGSRPIAKPRISIDSARSNFRTPRGWDHSYLLPLLGILMRLP